MPFDILRVESCCFTEVYIAKIGLHRDEFSWDVTANITSVANSKFIAVING